MLLSFLWHRRRCRSLFLPTILIWILLIVALISKGSICGSGNRSTLIVITSSDAFTLSTKSSFHYSRRSASIHSEKLSTTKHRLRIHRTIISSSANDDTEDNHRSLTSNEEPALPIFLTNATTEMSKINRRQQVRNFFRRFFGTNTTIRKLILRLTRNKRSYDIDKTLLEQQQANHRITDGFRNATTTSTFVESLRTTDTASLAKSLHVDRRQSDFLEQWNGKWNIIISNEFMKQYDTYLQHLGQPYIVRSIAKNLIGATTEQTSIQEDGMVAGAPSLLLRSINAKGTWERTLITSDFIEILATPISEKTDSHTMIDFLSNFTYPKSSINTTVVTADSERVTAEAWWIAVVHENDGDAVSNTVYHHSWLRGVTKYGGGDFESIRYLEQQPRHENNSDNDDNHHDRLLSSSDTLVCHSTFHPSNPQAQETARVTWRFRRIE